MVSIRPAKSMWDYSTIKKKIGGIMVESKVTVYGAYWCPDCRRAKKFLGEQFVPYKWVDIEEDKTGEPSALNKRP